MGRFVHFTEAERQRLALASRGRAPPDGWTIVSSGLEMGAV
jgi:hypothetical protein